MIVYYYGFSGQGAAPTEAPQPLPLTGDSANPALLLGLTLLGMIGLAVPAMAVYRKKKQ